MSMFFALSLPKYCFRSEHVPILTRMSAAAPCTVVELISFRNNEPHTDGQIEWLQYKVGGAREW